MFGSIFIHAIFQHNILSTPDVRVWKVLKYVQIVLTNKEQKINTCLWKVQLWQRILLKYGFCKKSLRKDEPLTSWTLFWAYLSSLLGGCNSKPTGGNSKPTQKWWRICSKKVFNRSEVHLSEVTSYKIHTLS